MVFNIVGVEFPHEKYYKKYVEIDNYFGELLVRGNSNAIQTQFGGVA